MSLKYFLNHSGCVWGAKTAHEKFRQLPYFLRLRRLHFRVWWQCFFKRKKFVANGLVLQKRAPPTPKNSPPDQIKLLLLDDFIPHFSQYRIYVFCSSQSAWLLGKISFLRRICVSWLFRRRIISEGMRSLLIIIRAILTLSLYFLFLICKTNNRCQ